MSSRLVLIATDFGSDSEPIARRGVDLARALDAQPVLLHVYGFPPPGPSSFYPEASRAIHDQARLDLRRLARACGLDSGHATLLVRGGRASGAILDTAHELGASLIVVGTHRPPTLERWLVGSVAEAVSRRAECPVMVIPCPDASHRQRRAVGS